MSAPGEGNHGATVRLHLQTACIQFANGDYSAATAELSRLLELDPTNPAALALKAEIAASRGTPESVPGDSEFTRWFNAHGQAAEPAGGIVASPMPGPAPEPAALEQPRGEFTKWWESHGQVTAEAGSAPSPQTPRPFSLPPPVSGIKAPADPEHAGEPHSEPLSGIGETTRIVRVAPNKFRVVPLAHPPGESESTPAAPEIARPAAADPPASKPPAWIAGAEHSPAEEPAGEFTRFFRSQSEGASSREREPAPPIQSGQQKGEDGPFRPVQPQAKASVSPGIAGTEPSQGGDSSGEFTRFFRTPNEGALYEQEPEPPASSAPETGEFSRIIRNSELEGGLLRPVQLQAAVPVRERQSEPAAQDPSGPGDFTRIIRGSESPRKPAPPVLPATRQKPALAPEPPPSGPGEYTRIVGSAAVAPPREPQVAAAAPAVTGSVPPRPKPFLTPIRLVAIFSVLAALALILIVFFVVKN
ncbi:MAG TPA: hypothetical protein VN924_30620 [Bryobacteraceae bacterium]|nr:hypothetical protein [Bryobacteraceae bacterium]